MDAVLYASSTHLNQTKVHYCIAVSDKRSDNARTHLKLSQVETAKKTQGRLCLQNLTSCEKGCRDVKTFPKNCVMKIHFQ